MAVSAVAIHEALADIAGREHCLREAPALARYAIDGLIPWMVVRPATADEVSRVVALRGVEITKRERTCVDGDARVTSEPELRVR